MSAEFREEAVHSEASALHRAMEQQNRLKRLERLRGGDSSLMGEVVHKVCCQCGTELNRRPRFKDSQGRYWCPQCNEADHARRRPAPCSACHAEVPGDQLHSDHGVMVCSQCLQQRHQGRVSVVQVSKAAAISLHAEDHLQWAKLLFALTAIVICIGVILWMVVVRH